MSSLSLARYRGTDYSVPTALGHPEVLIRGYVDTVVICCGAEVIARYVRSYEREDFVLDLLHYLALLERKIGALDQAAPLAGWDLPEAFTTLRRLIEARMTGTHASTVPRTRPTRHSRARRWRDAVAEPTELQAQYIAWLEAMPDNLQDGATADTLRAVCELNLTELQAVSPPRGFGRD